MLVVLWILKVIAAIGIAYGFYYFVMAWPLKRLTTAPPPPAGKQHRFAVLVFAKDEATVIGPLLESLNAQDYPRDAYHVFVTADNCTDDTAAIAAGLGATVWVRHNPDVIGKGYAMQWFFERFRTECAGQYDACVVFDADNLVDPGFLTEMNKQRNLGNEIALGYRLSKNPTSSAIAGTMSLFWLLQARLFHAGRVHRKLPCVTVGGTGYMFDLAVLPDGRWQACSMVEDIEFTLNSIAAGHTVTFTYDAVFYDEQPITWRQSLRQRYRWSLGTLQMLKYATPGLVRTLRARHGRTVDALLFSLGALIQGITAIAGTAMTVLLGFVTGQWVVVGITSGSVTVVAFLATAAVGRTVLALEGKWWPGAWKAVLQLPLFVISWAVLYVVVLFYHNSKWRPIPHTEALRLEQVGM